MHALLKERLPMPDYGPTGDPTLAERVRARRVALGWSQAELGEAMTPAMSQRWVSGIERAERGVGPDVLRQLALVLKTTTSYLLGETDSPLTPAARLEAAGINPGNLEHLEDEDLSSLIVGMVEQLVKRSFRPRSGEDGGDDADRETPRASKG
ncbi:HipB Predicted transcriptional regulators [uncultured Caudovirales phage]|uniref:HipB Predicted transcriptional regulators n=1 Tax=uncultured Caudovirales phage TaxID=2100421 RepID=A0A6J5P4Z4_9CAUD|nr:HipB Predicted transcriptional regulators [uncultured Caudovirales phage]CAB4173113.1 HipB Predicted transcriptional regulators [uncultured Caudovirales phage]CAB4179631.1 HipB Predicted transcriptional regulators [uncultured Caudovirales phage]CAB4204319.1 HipB Predicted transcriptional regulators [uncultured Caudovirales phage]CAB4216074.1 HipB Predicted transcriptional regulators [uncultured Caudovirales phage]